MDKLAEQRRTGLPIRYEKEYLRKYGTRVPIELLVHLVSDSKGEPEYYYSFVTDITESKLAEDALRQSERRMQIALLKRADHGVYQRRGIAPHMDPQASLWVHRRADDREARWRVTGV